MLLIEMTLANKLFTKEVIHVSPEFPKTIALAEPYVFKFLSISLHTQRWLAPFFVKAVITSN